MAVGMGDDDFDAPRAEDFSLVLGGPLYQLFLRTRLVRPPLELLRRRILVLVALTWLPPAILSALTGKLVNGPVPFLFDLTNLQFVTTLPILLGAEVFIHRRLRLLVPEFVRRDLVAQDDRSRFDHCVARALRLRDSVVAEIVLLVVAFTVGYWVWRTYGSLRVATWYIVPEGRSMRLTEAGYWLAFVSLPTSRFLLLRWYFRLGIWYAFLWRVSRLRLRLNPLHADRTGGLGFLEHSSMAFAPVLVAQSTFFATVLGNQIWHERVTLRQLQPEIIACMTLLMLFVLIPLTFFAPQLSDARLHGTREYGRLASRYTNAFRKKWLARRASPAEPLLGTSDIQSLSDLSNSYDVVRTMRIVPMSKTMLLRLAIVVVSPLVPLTVAAVPIDDLIAALRNVFV
jgi:hypothetical protein